MLLSSARASAPQLSNVASQYLDGTGAYSTPAGTTYTADNSTIQLASGVFSEKDNGTTNAKLAQMGANTIKGNNTGSTANATDLSAAQVAAILPLASSSAKGLAPQLSNVASQYLDGTGAFSTPAGTTYTADNSTLQLSSGVFSEKDNGTTNAKLAQMGANTIKGNNTGSTANAADLSAAQVAAILPLASSSAKGLAPQLSNVASQYLDGTGAFSTPAGTTYTADNSTLQLASGVFSEKDNGTTNAKLAQMGANTIKGNNTGSTANAADLSAAQVAAILPLVSSSAKGLAPQKSQRRDSVLGRDRSVLNAGDAIAV